jgi:hypothetical protein
MKKPLLAALTLAGAACLVLAAPVLAERGQGRGDGMFLQRFDQIDADKDGKLTEAEIQAWRVAQFAAADADKNGSLSAEELTAMQMARAQARMADRATRMIGKHDANGDGQLSAEELAQAGQGMGAGQSMFARADADGDGVITREEAEAAMGRMQGHGKGGKGGKGGHGKGGGGKGGN